MYYSGTSHSLMWCCLGVTQSLESRTSSLLSADVYTAGAGAAAAGWLQAQLSRPVLVQPAEHTYSPCMCRACCSSLITGSSAHFGVRSACWSPQARPEISGAAAVEVLAQ